MKATELRIGNWVQSNIDGCRSIDEGLIQIDQRAMMYLCDTNDFDRIEPIPLTEEWLVKFGFENTYSELTYKEYELNKVGVDINSDIITVSYNYGNDVEWVSFTHIKYIHTLQNFYPVITGEELTIKESVEA